MLTTGMALRFREKNASPTQSLYLEANPGMTDGYALATTALDVAGTLSGALAHVPIVSAPFAT